MQYKSKDKIELIVKNLSNFSQWMMMDSKIGENKAIHLEPARVEGATLTYHRIVAFSL